MSEVDTKRFPHRVKYPDGEELFFTEKMVLHSGAGYFIGTLCRSRTEDFVDMGSRESDYFRNKKEAEDALATREFTARASVENEFAYQNGLPRP